MRHYWGCMLCARFVWVKAVANFFLALPLGGANGSLYGVNGSLGEMRMLRNGMIGQGHMLGLS